MLAINARNDLGRLAIGVSPSQLVLNGQPCRLQGDDLDEDVDARLYSDKTFADERARRDMTESLYSSKNMAPDDENVDDSYNATARFA